MENIDRVNRFFPLRCLLFPVTLVVMVQYAVRCFALYRSSRKYATGQEETSDDRRYEQLLSCFSKWRYFENITFFFCFGKRPNNQQNVFMVNDNLDWESIALVSYLIKDLGLPYPRFLLNNILMGAKRKPPLFWDLIDTFYGQRDLERAIHSKRSFVMEKSFFDRHPKVVEILKSSRISIVPVFCCRPSRSRVWYVGGEAIKTSKLASFREDALVERLNEAFVQLERKTLKLIEKSRERKKFDPKALFTVNQKY